MLAVFPRIPFYSTAGWLGPSRPASSANQKKAKPPSEDKDENTQQNDNRHGRHGVISRDDVRPVTGMPGNHGQLYRALPAVRRAGGELVNPPVVRAAPVR